MNRYETHITIAANHAGEYDHLAEWAAENGVKWSHIVLDQGTSPSQPMLTFWGRSFDEQQATAEQMTAAIEALGERVVRIKTEADVDNDDVPRLAAEVDSSRNRYFEHHVKLLLPQCTDLDRLRQLVSPLGAQLSRNARRLRNDGLEERFVTQRVFHVTQSEARAALDSLMAAIEVGGHQILEIEAEYVLSDSNLDLDSGWIDSQHR